MSELPLVCRDHQDGNAIISLAFCSDEITSVQRHGNFYPTQARSVQSFVLLSKMVIRAVEGLCAN